jgi:hypothetical protein
MDEKEPPVLDYGTVPPGTPWDAVHFLIGAFGGLIGAFLAISLPAAGTQSIIVGVIVLAALLVAVIIIIVRLVRSRRRVTPFYQGMLAGACIGILLEGVCFVVAPR